MSAELSTDLRRALRRLKLSPVMATLPERLVLARQRKLPYAEFLELVLSDEIERRDLASATRRARAAGLDATMVLEAWDHEARVSYDRDLWAELCTLRFMEDSHGVLVLGPVGVGKTHLASALGHIAVRRRHSVVMTRADHLLKRLRASRLDGTYEAEMRRMIRVDLPGPVRAGGGAPSPGIHGGDVEPGPGGVAGGHGRSAPGPVRHRPAAELGPRTRHRGRVVPATPETEEGVLSEIRTSEIMSANRDCGAQGGPMLVARRWSLRGGKRQPFLARVVVERPAHSHRSELTPGLCPPTGTRGVREIWALCISATTATARCRRTGPKQTVGNRRRHQGETNGEMSRGVGAAQKPGSPARSIPRQACVCGPDHLARTPTAPRSRRG